MTWFSDWSNLAFSPELQFWGVSVDKFNQHKSIDLCGTIHLPPTSYWLNWKHDMLLQNPLRSFSNTTFAARILTASDSNIKSRDGVTDLTNRPWSLAQGLGDWISPGASASLQPLSAVDHASPVMGPRGHGAPRGPNGPHSSTRSRSDAGEQILRQCKGCANPVPQSQDPCAITLLGWSSL